MSFMLTNRPSPGNINTPFGRRPKPTPSSPSIHYGEDYGWGNGTTIRAAAKGRVTSVGMAGAYGLRTVIEHESGIETWYCHQSHVDVAVGDEVEGGEAIGVQGATGNVVGVHLHFEVRINGVAVDPEIYFRKFIDTNQEQNMADLTAIQKDLDTLGAGITDLQHVDANDVHLTADDLQSRNYLMLVAIARALARVETRLTNVDNRNSAIARAVPGVVMPPEAEVIASAER
jgi:hypothetical protein